MELFTKIRIPESDFKIDYKSNLVFFGSCFADNISSRFADRKFHVLANPLGVIYNPLSIERQIAKITGSESCGDDSDEAWCRWDYQREFSGKDLMRAVKTSREAIVKADVVFITLGTAFVYFLKETGKVVCNCHKESAELFERRLISVDEAAEALKNIVVTLHKIKPDIHVVFTVSPLRHLNDGAHGNNLSKATLHLAIEKVMQELAEEKRYANNGCDVETRCAELKCAGSRRENDAKINSVAKMGRVDLKCVELKCAEVAYFPSYEIVMDELRDYRFYAEDMSHLAPIAEDYIFERMCDTFCSDKTVAEMKQVEKFMKTANHRIVDAESARTATMAAQQIAKAKELEAKIAGLDLSAEKEHFRKFATI